MMIAIGNFFFAYRNAIFPMLALCVFLPGARVLQDPMRSLWLGFAIAACGEAVRFATIGLKYIIRGGQGRRVFARDLVTQGVYAHCRNPMYVGNLLILAGVALASNSWSCVVISLPLFIFIYRSIISAEEQFLQQKFGPAFDAYAREVPRFIPRLKGLRSTFSGARFHWRRIAVKEYGTSFAWIAGICVIGLVHLARAGQMANRHLATQVLLAVAAIALLGWILIRTLKKNHVLISD